MESKDILGNWIVRNLILAVVFVAVLVTAISISLSLVTHHNQEIEVPDFTNMTYDEACREAAEAGVKVQISDSIFVRRLKPGAVYMQTPKPGEMVKKGRRVLLTTNTIVAKKVAVPSMVGLSLHEAKAELARNGLVLGRLVYSRDIATNNVLRQQYRNADVKPGTMVMSGSSINLVLGLSSNDARTFVPNLSGKQYMRAVDILHENSLNVGKLVFDKDIRTYADSVSAFVYSQRPSNASEPVRRGSDVALYLTLDESKLSSK